jgi:hypothetical protein
MYINHSNLGLSQLQDLKPLNIVLLEPDTNDLTSILDQDKYTCYQDSLEDQNYVPGIEEIALILSTKVKSFCFSQLSDSQIVGVAGRVGKNFY